jgi:DnaD/phage-associated family protein
MAKYRQLYTEFWSDSFVLELTPEEKYFYLYLISNSKTAQCGIYEISKRIIETETGYNRDTVEKLIKRFCDYNKIMYCEETKEIMIINWIKYNAPNNINAIKCVNKELIKVKHKDFLKVLFNKCEVAGLEVEKIFENIILADREETEELSEVIFDGPQSRALQGPYKGLPSNRIRSNKEEVINKKQKTRNKEEEAKMDENNATAANNEELKDIVRIFEENVHAISPLEYEKFLGFSKQVSSEVIIMAIEEAVAYNAKSMKYISKVLCNWISSGVKTMQGVKDYQEKWTNKKNSNVKAPVKNGSFCDYAQRSYDFDALEKRLLAHLDDEYV